MMFIAGGTRNKVRLSCTSSSLYLLCQLDAARTELFAAPTMPFTFLHRRSTLSLPGCRQVAEVCGTSLRTVVYGTFDTSDPVG